MIEHVTSYDEWTKYLNDFGSPSFLQSWEWGDLNNDYFGYDVERITVKKNKRIVAIAQILKIRAKRGSFLFIPHGPVMSADAIQEKDAYEFIINKVMNYLIKIGRQERFDFIRIAPVEKDITFNDVYSEYGFRTSPIYMHAERLWQLPLNKSEDELLQNMRKTTRYLIRRAPKDKIEIVLRTDKDAIKDFWKLYETTAERENFIPFSKKFIDKEFIHFSKHKNATYLFGKVDNNYLASALIVFTKSTGFYHQGASIHTKLPVTYALQWEAIKQSIQRGCSYYNFWGILQPGRTPKAWYGLTLFKKGFGGEQVDYIPTQDFPLSPKYWISFSYEQYLRLKRGII